MSSIIPCTCWSFVVISSLEKCLSKSFTHHLIEQFVYLLVRCKSYFKNIIWIQIHFSQLFFLFSGLYFQIKCFSFWWSSIYLFFLLSLLFLVLYVKNHCLIQGHKFILMFSSKFVFVCLFVLALTFRSLVWVGFCILCEISFCPSTIN